MSLRPASGHGIDLEAEAEKLREIIRTGTRAKKSSAGYDLTRLFVGSEGTLGVMTEITVKLYPLPEAVSAAICSFPSIEAAVRTTMTVIQMGVPIVFQYNICNFHFYLILSASYIDKFLHQHKVYPDKI